MPLENGYLLNQRYRILDILGQGGMGAVYRAFDENLDLIVAVKENIFQSEDYVRQFQKEAKTLASLRHPNLPRVFDYFVIDQQGQYLVMDFIEGDDLKQWMSRKEGISETETLQIGIAICDALIYLHSSEPAVTHRDIKPGNIKITPQGEVVLVDFGLVKLMNKEEITNTAARAMTPGYSPPEQYGSASTDHRSDIFSLGATLYAALAGFLPEDSLARTTGKAELTPLKHYQPHISYLTASAIEKALNLRFEDRWQSAQEFKETLIAALERMPVAVRENSRLTAVAKTDPHRPNRSDGHTTSSGPLEKLLSRVAGKPTRLDPVWVVFGLLIVLLLILLSLSFLYPNSLRGVISGVVNEGTDERLIPTETPARTETLIPTKFSNTVVAAIVSSPTPEIDITQPITPSPTPRGGGGGVFAYVSEHTGLPQIWLFNINLRKTTQLTDLPDGACQPDWSPDGSKIVFTSPCLNKRTRYKGSNLYIMEVETGLITPLTASLEGDFDPAWSPDGDWIAFTSLINGRLQLMKINLEDQATIRLSDDAYDDSQPSWSPDGSQIAFIRLRSGRQVWLINADGEEAVQFTLSGLIDNSNPAWYPDESLILFSQALGADSPSKQLYGMRLEDIRTEEEYLILPRGRSEYIHLMDSVDVSPDGFWLAFEYWYFDVLSDIYIMTFPGGNLIQMTDHPEMDYDPVWQP